MSGGELRGVETRGCEYGTEGGEGAGVYVELYVDGGHFASAYGEGKGEYMLVRPDGYAGWVGLEENLPDLDRYLAGVLPR